MLPWCFVGVVAGLHSLLWRDSPLQELTMGHSGRCSLVGAIGLQRRMGTIGNAVPFLNWNILAKAFLLHEFLPKHNKQFYGRKAIFWPALVMTPKLHWSYEGNDGPVWEFHQDNVQYPRGQQTLKFTRSMFLNQCVITKGGRQRRVRKGSGVWRDKSLVTM